jgi:hypothetical protein
MLMTNFDREEFLSIFSSMYAATDYDMMRVHMPLDKNDPDGLLFQEYFDFLQSLYALRSDIQMLESEEDLDFIMNNILVKSRKFNYPINILYGFLGGDERG